jgi:hypothetical protein
MAGGGGGSGGGGGHAGSGSMLPAELVGTWTIAEGDAGISYQFTADGKIVYAGDLSTYTGCTYEVQTSYTGYVTMQGGLLTLTPVDGTQISSQCGSVTTSSFNQIEVDAYEVQGTTLYLQNQETGVVLTLSRS